MKLYTLGLYEKSMPDEMCIRDKLLCAREAGYDFLELSVDETDEKLARLEWSKDERERLVRDMYEMGIPVRTMCLSGHRKYPLGSLNSALRRRGMEIMEKAIELADDLGIRIIMLAGYDVYYERSSEQTRAFFEENLKRASEMAACKSVLLGFETMETDFMNTVGKAMKYVRLVDSDYLGVYPDIGNITNAAKTYATSVTEDLKAGNGHLLAMHLKETKPGKFREIPYGAGHVDFEEAISAAWKLGIRKFVTEFWYTGNRDWRDELSNVNRMMTRIIENQRRGEHEHAS